MSILDIVRILDIDLFYSFLNLLEGHFLGIYVIKNNEYDCDTLILSPNLERESKQRIVASKSKTRYDLNPNKAGFFEGSFFCGGGQEELI